MINFKPIELKDRGIFQRYLKDYNFKTYEYSFLTLYIWRKMYNIEYGIIDNTLIIKKYNKSTGSYFMQPIGYNDDNLLNIMIQLKSIKDKDSGFRSLFRDLETPFILEIEKYFGENIECQEDSNNFDYVYDSKQLIALSGEKFHRKKNQYNQFVNKYNYVVKEVFDEKIIEDCINFSKVWYENKREKNEQLDYELKSIEDILKNVTQLNIKGIAVYVDNRMVGFSIGEIVNRILGIVHIEKGDLAYSGIYAFLNKTFAEKQFSTVNFINRQEDLGIEGLRKAKMAYHPIKLEKKYIVDL